MIDFKYVYLDPRLKEFVRGFQTLLALFNHLVLMLNGDVERALKYMKYLQDSGYIDKDADLAKFREALAKGGLINLAADGKMKLTKKGERGLRKKALEEIFSSLKKGDFGWHRTPFSGDGGEKLPETRPFRFGDDFINLDLNRTVHNALKRTGPDVMKIGQDDLEVNETEHNTSCATALLVDISHSMVLYGEDRITPAKKVALALSELIKTRYPKDSLDLIAFGDDAFPIKLSQLPYITAGPYHTNTKAALQVARRILLRKKHPNKQVFMITDGKPSAMYEEGRLYVNPIGLDRRVVASTLEEAQALRRNKIVITTFMLTDEPVLVEFVQKLTRINRGRAYFTRPDNIASCIFVDYIKNRRRKITGLG